MRAFLPQTEEDVTARCKQLARDDRREPRVDPREPFVFTFESRAIAAFAREIVARESHDTVTRNCASQRLHANPESIGDTHADDAANTRAAHDSCDSRSHIIRGSHRDSNYSLQFNFAK